MIGKLNPIERECQDVLMMVREVLSPHHPTFTPKRDVIEVMGAVREALKKLDNKDYGCASGRHAGYCTCNGEVLGHAKR